MIENCLVSWKKSLGKFECASEYAYEYEEPLRNWLVSLLSFWQLFYKSNYIQQRNTKKVSLFEGIKNVCVCKSGNWNVC